jgi:predicted DNA-binding antitoxin AbrB/MazE fold protein
MVDKRKVIYSNSLRPLESYGLNQGMSKKVEKKEDFLDRLRLSESLEGEVKRESMTGRNL